LEYYAYRRMNMDNSIKDYREIITENPYKEMWNHLNYFADADYVDKKVRERFELKDGKHVNCTKKRAKSIAYSMQQAHNYFRASQEVDLSVKPVLIYYGMVSLANVIFLYNLDSLKSPKIERDHGLELKPINDSGNSTQGILENISCEICKNKDSGQPYGHFKNFYNSIVPECVFVKQTFSENDNFLSCKKPFENVKKLEIGNLVVRKFELLTMLRFLPDMIGQLHLNSIDQNLCSGVLEHKARKPKQNKEIIIEINFSINELSSEKKEYFENLYRQNKAISSSSISNYPRNLHFLYKSEIESENHYFPDMVQDLQGNIYYIYNAEEYIQELANLYICFYCTGMLCRYSPDYWMNWLEKNVGFRHLMDSLCSVAIRKFPNLILNQLTQSINHFHL